MSATNGSTRQTLTSDAKAVTEQFWGGVIWGRGHLDGLLPGSRTLSDSLKAKEDRYESILRIRYVIENSRDELMREAGALILSYLERYRVKSDSADPFKIAFWFGVALAEKVGEVDQFDKRVVLLITMECLDIFCAAHCQKRMAPDMRSKMDMSIAEGKHLEEFGQHGLYHSFKCISKV